MGLTPDALLCEANDPKLASLVVDLSIFPEEVVLKACYAFTGRAYLQVSRLSESQVRVEVRPQAGHVLPAALAGEFGNELIDQRIRADLARETAQIREIIVAQAFAEANLDPDQ